MKKPEPPKEFDEELVLAKVKNLLMKIMGNIRKTNIYMKHKMKKVR